MSILGRTLGFIGSRALTSHQTGTLFRFFINKYPRSMPSTCFYFHTAYHQSAARRRQHPGVNLCECNCRFSSERRRLILSILYPASQYQHMSTTTRDSYTLQRLMSITIYYITTAVFNYCHANTSTGTACFRRVTR